MNDHERKDFERLSNLWAVGKATKGDEMDTRKVLNARKVLKGIQGIYVEDASMMIFITGELETYTPEIQEAITMLCCEGYCVE
jgi:hypothetical protein